MTIRLRTQDVMGEEDWQAGCGRLQSTTRHFKDNPQSLHWTWREQARLWRAGLAIPAEQCSQVGMVGWIYNESPRDDALVFSLGSVSALAAGQAPFQFRFRLNFRGWRAFRIQLMRDARTSAPLTAIERLEITPPTPAGDLFIGNLELGESVSSQRSADYQIPEHSGDLGSWWAHWPLHYSRQQPSEPLPPAISDGERDDFEAIFARYRHWLLGDDRQVDGPLARRGDDQIREYIALGWRSFEALDLWVDADGWITGPALHMRKGTNTFHHVFYNALLPLVFDYRLKHNAKALEAALQLFDYVHDQGWAEGSANGSMILNGLVFAPYCHAIAMLKDELQAMGRFEQAWRTALWYLSFGKSFSRFDQGYIESNADELRSTVFTSLIMVLCMDDAPQKVQYMRGWLAWLQSGLEISPRFTGLIKPDGLGFHHQGVYAGAYATEAYEFCALAAYLLHGTRFALTKPAVENLRLALKTQDTLTHTYDVPYTTMGRMPHPGVRIFSAYAWLALAHDPVDPELVGIFMRLWDPTCACLDKTLSVDLDGEGGKFLCKQTPGRLQLLQALADRDLPATPSPEGFWSKPWGALAIHRRAGWLLAVKGWSQYVWDFEMHPKAWAVKEENVFARYWSYGTLQPITHGAPANPVDSGWALDRGWDWCRWPGATTPHLELDELYDPATSWECRFFSAASFVGGVECEGNGLFVLKLHEHYYDPTFRAYKSYFFFDDVVICLGSNIASRDTAHATETTLFQSHMTAEEMPVEIDGESITAFPFSYRGEAGRALTLRDPYGNGYILPDGGALHLERRIQHSRDAWNRGATSGAYTTCWLDHGHGPKDDGYGEVRYHYALLVQASAGRLAALAQEPPYTVLQQNHQAHILRHQPSRTMAWALFESDWIVPHGVLRRTDTPVMVMVREADAGIHLSVADPDLRLPKRRNMAYLDDEANATPSRPSELRLQLRGHWQSADPACMVRLLTSPEPITELTLSCRHGLTSHLHLTTSQVTS